MVDRWMLLGAGLHGDTQYSLSGSENRAGHQLWNRFDTSRVFAAELCGVCWERRLTHLEQDRQSSMETQSGEKDFYPLGPELCSPAAPICHFAAAPPGAQHWRSWEWRACGNSRSRWVDNHSQRRWLVFVLVAQDSHAFKN